jgi:hypothetical protein
MKTFATVTVLTAVMMMATGCSSKKEQKEQPVPELSSVLENNITKKSIDQYISEWSEPSKEAADFMINKYGLPHSVTENTLVWNNVGAFKRSVVYKEAIPHHFPKEHTDVLEQTINYQAPQADKVSKVWQFDGSVVLDRTEGEMSARCDREEANVLALNLAHEIITGKRDVQDARLEYGRQILALTDGDPSYYTKTLVFSPAEEKAGDPDHSILDKLRRTQRGTGTAEEPKMEAQESKEMQEAQRFE